MRNKRNEPLTNCVSFEGAADVGCPLYARILLISYTTSHKTIKKWESKIGTGPPAASTIPSINIPVFFYIYFFLLFLSLSFSSSRERVIMKSWIISYMRTVVHICVSYEVLTKLLEKMPKMRCSAAVSFGLSLFACCPSRGYHFITEPDAMI